MKKNNFSNIQFRPSALDSLSTYSSFYNQATLLRAQFEKKFAHPMIATSDRFCWDYWSVKDQYRLLRTPAQYFFEPRIYQNFLNHLLLWGRKNIGCQMISEPWLSAYIDGSFQNLHSDVPHGPYSFVYSLTPWQKRSFSGGETLIAKPKLLRYFSELNPNTSHEEKDLFKRVPPKFNQLTLFDPRYPHGVARVNGVENLLGARLVIHGWFTEPRPMIEGGLSPKKAGPSLDKLALHLLKQFEMLPYSGLFTARFKVNGNGTISQATVLASHLIGPQGDLISKRRVNQTLCTLDEIQFPKASTPSEITLPLMIGL